MKKLMTALLAAGLFGTLALAGCAAGGVAKDEGCEVTRIVLVSTGGDVNTLDAYVFEPDPSLTHVSLAPDNDLSHVGEESPGLRRQSSAGSDCPSRRRTGKASSASSARSTSWTFPK